MIFLKHKKALAALAICLSIKSIYATDGENWPKSGITFKLLGITSDENEKMDQRCSSIDFRSFKGHSHVLTGEEINITKSQYDKNHFKLFAVFWFDKQRYTSDGMALTDFVKTYGKELGSTHIWEISVHGTGKYQNDKKQGQMETCIWRFQPRIF